MSTCAQLIDFTLLQLSGYSTQQDQSTPLTSSINASVTTVPVLDGSQVSRGLAEIDSEIVFIESVDAGSNTATVVRGFRSSTAAAHNAGARLVMSPLFYRSAVLQALNETVAAVYPQLYGTGVTTFSANGSQNTFALPAGAETVLDVKWKSVGPTQEWVPVRRWTADSNANTTAFASGSTITIFDGVPSGRTIQVTYTKAPTVFSAESDAFSVTGLPASSEDVIRLGAMWRLVPMLDNPHFAGFSAESDFAANMRPTGGAISASRFYMQQYQYRLAEEAARLNSLFPTRVHYTS